jgi:hypothetical protein
MFIEKEVAVAYIKVIPSVLRHIATDDLHNMKETCTQL